MTTEDYAAKASNHNSPLSTERFRSYRSTERGPELEIDRGFQSYRPTERGSGVIDQQKEILELQINGGEVQSYRSTDRVFRSYRSKSGGSGVIDQQNRGGLEL